MPILDSAHNGRRDPQDKPLDMIAKCGCGCRQVIYFGDEDVWKHDGKLFAGTHCIARYVGAQRMTLEWL